MKKIYLVLLMFGTFCQESISQNYVPFPTAYATWNTLFYGQYSATDIYTINYQYMLNGDTILKGQNYKKIYYIETDYATPPIYYVGGLREDTAKRIYFFPASLMLPTPSGHTFPNDTSEHLLYTFDNLEVGAILPINGSVKQIKVVGIDSVQIGSSYRKRYEIQDNLMATEYWIEGIGSTKELLSPFTYEFEWTFYTLCFNNGDLYYINSPDGEDYCHYMVGVDKEENEIIQVYPNPATDVIRITKTLPGGMDISIFSLTGQLNQLKSKYNAGDQLDISQLKSGVYFVRLIVGNKRYLSKFVKN